MATRQSARLAAKPRKDYSEEQAIPRGVMAPERGHRVHFPKPPAAVAPPGALLPTPTSTPIVGGQKLVDLSFLNEDASSSDWSPPSSPTFFAVSPATFFAQEGPCLSAPASAAASATPTSAVPTPGTADDVSRSSVTSMQEL